MIKTQSIKNIFLAAALILVSISAISFIASPSLSAQELKDKVCSGSNFNLDGNGAACRGDSATQAESSLNTLIRTIVNIFTVIVGIVAVIMIIVGGFKFITSGGDSGKVTSARQTVIYALIGLIIVALAQVVVRFILSKV